MWKGGKLISLLSSTFLPVLRSNQQTLTCVFAVTTLDVVMFIFVLTFHESSLLSSSPSLLFSSADVRFRVSSLTTFAIAFVTSSTALIRSARRSWLSPSFMLDLPAKRKNPLKVHVDYGNICGKNKLGKIIRSGNLRFLSLSLYKII